MATEQQTFVMADRALQRVVEQIRAEHWNTILPEWFPLASNHRGKEMTLRQLVNYIASDDAWVPTMLAGGTMDEAGRDQFAGDLLGDAPLENYGQIVDVACTAAETFDELDRTVHLSFGDYPAQHYFWQINQFRALRAVDIARVIGVDETLPPELVQSIWDELTPHIEEWRKIGVFGPAIDVPADAPLQDRLLGLTGRTP